MDVEEDLKKYFFFGIIWRKNDEIKIFSKDISYNDTPLNFGGLLWWWAFLEFKCFEFEEVRHVDDLVEDLLEEITALEMTAMVYLLQICTRIR